MSSVYDNVQKYPYLQQFAEWAIMTNNNIVDVSGKKTLLFPVFPQGYYRVGILNGDLVVGNDSGVKGDYYIYLPKYNAWMNLYNNNAYNVDQNTKNLNFLYYPESGTYIITNIMNEVLLSGSYIPPHQVAAPSSFPEEEPSSSPQPADERLTRTRTRTRKDRSPSSSPSPPMDRLGKSGCEGPGCAVMGGKKKTRRHKSRKQKKSKSKKHKKSKSKKSTRKK